MLVGTFTLPFKICAAHIEEHLHTIQYIQYNTIQYNTIQYNTWNCQH